MTQGTTTTTPAAANTGRRSLQAFRAVAVLEALSWLVLIVATIVKYSTTPHQQTAVHIMGPVHGALFVLYVLLALEARRHTRWNARTTLIVLVDSVIPFGGFVVARRSDLR